MACALMQDYEYTCDAVGVGGVKMFWFIEIDNIISITESSGVITSLVKASNKIFRKYSLTQETSDVDEAISGNKQNRTLYYNQTAILIINKQQVAVRDEIKQLARNKLVIIAQDNNNSYRLYGKENGLQMLTGEIASGTAYGDRNGYMMTFTGNEADPAPFVSQDVIDSLQNAVIIEALFNINWVANGNEGVEFDVYDIFGLTVLAGSELFLVAREDRVIYPGIPDMLESTQYTWTDKHILKLGLPPLPGERFLFIYKKIV